MIKRKEKAVKVNNFVENTAKARRARKEASKKAARSM